MTTGILMRLLACSLTLAAAAEGGVTTFNNNSGNNWSTAANWSPSGQVPTEADRVVIPTGETCNININAFADTIVVEAGATLSIFSDQSLTLDNDDNNISPSGNDHSIVDGQVIIEYDPDPAVLSFTGHSHIVDGDGMILGVDTPAEIRIAAGIRFQSELADPSGGVRGGLTIKGLTAGGLTNGLFRNYGRVHAVTTIIGHEDTEIEDQEGSVWTVHRCPSRVRFDRESLSLEGDFVISSSGGAFEFNADVTTCGELVYNNPGLLFDNGAVFRYVSFSGSEPNPGDGKVPSSCIAPCEVSEDDTPCVE